MSIDIERYSSSLILERNKNEEFKNQIDFLDNKMTINDVVLNGKDNIIVQNDIDINEKNKIIVSIRSHVSALTQELNFNKKKVNNLQEENNRIKENEIIINLKLKEAEVSLNQEIKRFRILQASNYNTNNQNVSQKNIRNSISNNNNENDDENNISFERKENTEEGKDSQGNESRNMLIEYNNSLEISTSQKSLKSEKNEKNQKSKYEYAGQTDNDIKRQIQQITDRKGVSGLISLLKENIDCEKLSWRVPRALRELVVRDDEMRRECCSLQCDELLLVCIQTFPSNIMVQSQVLRLLGALAYGNDQIRRRTGEKGVIRLILSAISKHGEVEETLLLYALTALTNLMHNSLENRSRFLEANGVDYLIRSMSTDGHKNSAVIQRQSCWTILTLAASDDASKAIMSGI